MIKEIELTPLELDILTNLVSKRLELQGKELEFVQLLFKASGTEFPKTNVELKENKLVWVEELEIA